MAETRGPNGVDESTPAPRVLLVINATVATGAEENIARGRSPRKDYLELQRELGADILDLGVLERHVVGRVARRIVGSAVLQAVLAWNRSSRYDVVFVDRETCGFLLGALLRFRPRRPRLVVIAHILSTRKKRLMGRLAGAHRSISCLVVHSTGQQAVARQEFGFGAHQVALVPYQTDDQFWSPVTAPPRNQICSVGLEFRDYDTLVQAVDGLPVDVVIAAASYWSRHRVLADRPDGLQTLPARVRVASFDYTPLRQLYAESLFVVVPLFDVDNQAGITVILEAMAMGKALIVTRTRGQADVIRDRRRNNRSDPTRLTQPDWIRRLGASAEVAEGQTGLYVTPGDDAELRRAIVFLLEHPDYARQLGANGRKVIQKTMNLDHFVQRVAALIRGEPGAALGEAAGDYESTGTDGEDQSTRLSIGS